MQLPNTHLMIKVRHWRTQLRQQIIIKAGQQLKMYCSYLTSMQQKIGHYCLEKYLQRDTNENASGSKGDLKGSGPLSSSLWSLYVKFPFLQPMETFRNYPHIYPLEILIFNLA